MSNGLFETEFPRSGLDKLSCKVLHVIFLSRNWGYSYDTIDIQKYNYQKEKIFFGINIHV